MNAVDPPFWPGYNPYPPKHRNTIRWLFSGTRFAREREFAFLSFVPSKNEADTPDKKQVDQFILEEIESVPHLEALLLLWRSRPRQWSLEEMAKALYIPAAVTLPILRDLCQLGIAVFEADRYASNPASGQNELLGELDETYRRELIRISRMIHSKGSPSVREFARAFKFRKD